MHRCLFVVSLVLPAGCPLARRSHAGGCIEHACPVQRTAGQPYRYVDCDRASQPDRYAGRHPATHAAAHGPRGRGYVQLADGSGLADISICRNFASYPGTVVAKTDANGYFESTFVSIPGDEMVGVW